MRWQRCGSATSVAPGAQSWAAARPKPDSSRRTTTPSLDPPAACTQDTRSDAGAAVAAPPPAPLLLLAVVTVARRPADEAKRAGPGLASWTPGNWLAEAQGGGCLRDESWVTRGSVGAAHLAHVLQGRAAPCASATHCALRTAHRRPAQRGGAHTTYVACWQGAAPQAAAAAVADSTQATLIPLLHVAIGTIQV